MIPVTFARINVDHYLDKFLVITYHYVRFTRDFGPWKKDEEVYILTHDYFNSVVKSFNRSDFLTGECKFNITTIPSSENKYDV